ncbi:MAG: ketopantoate reductase family protein [Lachnospiraceae bacterium]|nr:ketopantoate reductase family protein [Lachnospiraceae bacterium]
MIKNVSIIGLGALGMMYGKNLTEALGYENVSFIMNRERYERNKDRKYICNGEEYRFHMVPVDEAGQADLIIVAVKYPGLSSALDDMASSIGDDTIIMSVMNGISSEGILAERFGAEKLIYTVAQGMDAGKFGDELTFTKKGELYIGLGPGGRKEHIEEVADVLKRANLAFVIEDDIMHRIWAKFMLNVGANQTAMVYGTTYGGLVSDGEPNYIFVSAMREVIAVAREEGIILTEDELSMYVRLTGTLNPELMPSMAQDRINKKPSEVDAFSGALIKLAEKHGILVPVNRYLNRRAKEIEAEYTHRSVSPTI